MKRCVALRLRSGQSGGAFGAAGLLASFDYAQDRLSECVPFRFVDRPRDAVGVRAKMRGSLHYGRDDDWWGGVGENEQRQGPVKRGVAFGRVGAPWVRLVYGTRERVPFRWVGHPGDVVAARAECGGLSTTLRFGRDDDVLVRAGRTSNDKGQ